MAKFNITVELDWLDEEGCIDNAVKEAIVDNISARFSTKISDQIVEQAETQITQKINGVIDTKVNEITENFLHREFVPLDKYGDQRGPKTTVLELLKKRLDDYLEEKVDKNGNTGGYNCETKRLNYIIQKNIDDSLNRKIEAVGKQIKSALEQYIDTTLKAQIGENVAKAIGLDKLIKTK